MLPARRFTPADLISLSRLPLAGAFILASDTVTRLTLVGIAGLTDWLDGWIARRRGVGRYGAVIDPAADRVFVVVILATLVAENVLTLAQCLLLLLRDIATTLGVLIVRIAPSLRPERLTARWSGKIVTALQFVALIAVLIEPTTLKWLLPIVVAASVVAIADYALALRRHRALTAVLVALAAGSTQLEAQPGAEQPTWRALARVDAFIARVDAIHVGAGLTRDLGSYVRLDGALAGGVARAGDDTGASGRAELVGRFLLDPFRQSRWGFYAGGGLIARSDDGDDVRGYFTLLFGAELPVEGRMLPALELGIGGGTRVGLVVRRGRMDRR